MGSPLLVGLKLKSDAQTRSAVCPGRDGKGRSWRCLARRGLTRRAVCAATGPEGSQRLDAASGLTDQIEQQTLRPSREPSPRGRSGRWRAPANGWRCPAGQPARGRPRLRPDAPRCIPARSLRLRSSRINRNRAAFHDVVGRRQSTASEQGVELRAGPGAPLRGDNPAGGRASISRGKCRLLRPADDPGQKGRASRSGNSGSCTTSSTGSGSRSAPMMTSMSPPAQPGEHFVIGTCRRWSPFVRAEGGESGPWPSGRTDRA